MVMYVFPVNLDEKLRYILSVVARGVKRMDRIGFGSDHKQSFHFQIRSFLFI